MQTMSFFQYPDNNRQYKSTTTPPDKFGQDLQINSSDSQIIGLAMDGSNPDNYLNFLDTDAIELEWDSLTGSQNSFPDVRDDDITNNFAANF